MAPIRSLAGLLLAVANLGQIAFSAPTSKIAAVEQRDESLLGYNPTNVVQNEDTDAISYSFVPGQTDSAVIGAPLDFTTVENPQPVRGSKGGLDPGPRTEGYDRLNPDKLAPPGTDHGNVNNAEWPLGLSHAKLGLGRGGWSRQQVCLVFSRAEFLISDYLGARLLTRCPHGVKQ